LLRDEADLDRHAMPLVGSAVSANIGEHGIDRVAGPMETP
jgi:hypothetical protein